MAKEYPPFHLNGPRFDQTTFHGRLMHFLDVIDPRTLLVSDANLQSSIKLLEDFKYGTLPPGTTSKELWEAKKIKQAIIHPDTGEKVFMPFRMSGRRNVASKSYNSKDNHLAMVESKSQCLRQLCK